MPREIGKETVLWTERPDPGKRPLLREDVRYMELILAGKQTWSDRVEKSDWWTVGVEAIAAGREFTIKSMEVD